MLHWCKAVHAALALGSCSSASHHKRLSARSLHDDTEQDKCEFGKKWCVYRQQRVKEMDSDGRGGGVELGRERKRVKERSEGERVLMMLKIGRWAPSTLSVNHCYSFLSTYLSSCPPLTELSLSFLSLSSPSLILWGGIQNFHLLTIFGLSP